MKTISLSEFLSRALTEKGYDYEIIRKGDGYALVVWDNGIDWVVWEVTPHYVYELLFPTREEAYAFATDYQSVANANMWEEYPIEEVVDE